MINSRHYYTINNIIHQMKYSVLAILLLVFSFSILYSLQSSNLQMQQNSANFSQNEKTELRFIVTKAGIMYSTNYSALADYVKNEVRLTYPSYWNVIVYNSQDYNSRFYLTGTYDSIHQNKRFFQVTDSQPYGFSILILENNNTQPSLPKPQATKIVSLGSQHQSLQYIKTKSPYVTTSQEAGIDLAMTTAYTWNKNIVDFSKVLQKLTETNLNEHWQVLTSFDSLPNFAFRYTSQYEQWIEYSGYGIGATHWHVYIWRNYITG